MLGVLHMRDDRVDPSMISLASISVGGGVGGYLLEALLVPLPGRWFTSSRETSMTWMHQGLTVTILACVLATRQKNGG